MPYRVYYEAVSIWENQYGMSGTIQKKYNTNHTYTCPKCKMEFKLRKKSKVGKLRWFLSRCEMAEARDNPERRCTGTTLKCPYCGEPLKVVMRGNATVNPGIFVVRA
jgi:DNA-directed RNA polymerase subunit RPC12/RpoP